MSAYYSFKLKRFEAQSITPCIFHTIWTLFFNIFYKISIKSEATRLVRYIKFSTSYFCISNQFYFVYIVIISLLREYTSIYDRENFKRKKKKCEYSFLKNVFLCCLYFYLNYRDHNRKSSNKRLTALPIP